jgi:hypothetical protein
MLKAKHVQVGDRPEKIVHLFGAQRVARRRRRGDEEALVEASASKSAEPLSGSKTPRAATRQYAGARLSGTDLARSLGLIRQTFSRPGAAGTDSIGVEFFRYPR